MKIAYDGKRAMNNQTGLGNYSRMVLQSVATEYPDTQMQIYAPRLSDNPRMQDLRSMPNVSIVLPDRKPGGSIWRTWGISKQLLQNRPDLYHGLSNELPLNIAKTGIPTVLTMHDVIYRRLPHCYALSDRLLYDLKYGHSCRIASHIIAVSECTKRDVMHYYGVSEERITVVYQGCDDIFKTPGSTDDYNKLKHLYPTLPQRFMLQVGTIEERKNAELSVRALEGLPPDVSLVLVGRGGKYLKKLMSLADELRVADRVVALQGVKTEDIALLNRCASVVVYPSRYEGFGIPILEALCSRTPVVAATSSCLEEAGGSGSIYVSPDDPKALADAVNAVLDKTIDLDTMIAQGLKHAARFSNDNVARETMAVYHRLINNSTF